MIVFNYLIKLKKKLNKNNNNEINKFFKNQFFLEASSTSSWRSVKFRKSATMRNTHAASKTKLLSILVIKISNKIKTYRCYFKDHFPISICFI